MASCQSASSSHAFASKPSCSLEILIIENMTFTMSVFMYELAEYRIKQFETKQSTLHFAGICLFIHMSITMHVQSNPTKTNKYYICARSFEQDIQLACMGKAGYNSQSYLNFSCIYLPLGHTSKQLGG